MYTWKDQDNRINEARQLDMQRGERKRAFEREMKGTFDQNAAFQREMQGTYNQNALERRALQGTFRERADLDRELQGTFDQRNKAENWRASLASNTQIRGQDLASNTAIRGQDTQMLDNQAQRSFMDRIYGMQDQTQRFGYQEQGKDRRLQTFTNAFLRLQDDAFTAFPDDEAKRGQYIQAGRKQLEQLYPEFGRPKPQIPKELFDGDEPGAKTPSRGPYIGGQTVNPSNSEYALAQRRKAYYSGDKYWQVGTTTPYDPDPYGFMANRNTPGPLPRRGTVSPEPSMDALTQRTLQMHGLPQSNATDNTMTVLGGWQRPLRRPAPTQPEQGWDIVRRRTGGGF
jgi:hypothetical protein